METPILVSSTVDSEDLERFADRLKSAHQADLASLLRDSRSGLQRVERLQQWLRSTEEYRAFIEANPESRSLAKVEYPSNASRAKITITLSPIDIAIIVLLLM